GPEAESARGGSGLKETSTRMTSGHGGTPEKGRAILAAIISPQPPLVLHFLQQMPGKVTAVLLLQFGLLPVVPRNEPTAASRAASASHRFSVLVDGRIIER